MARVQSMHALHRYDGLQVEVFVLLTDVACKEHASLSPIPSPSSIVFKHFNL